MTHNRVIKRTGGGMRYLFALLSAVVLTVANPDTAAADPFDHFGVVGDWTVEGITRSPTEYACMALGSVHQKAPSNAYALAWIIRGSKQAASSYFQAQTDLSEGSSAKLEVLFDGREEVEAEVKVHLMALQAMMHDPDTLRDVMQKFASSSQVSARVFSPGHGITTADLTIEHGQILVEKMLSCNKEEVAKITS